MEALPSPTGSRRPREPGKPAVLLGKGCQYTSGDFASLCENRAVTQSMSRPGQCWDNAVSESFFVSLKNELI